MHNPSRQTIGNLRLLWVLCAGMFATPSMALTINGPLADALVDASSGELSNSEARSLVARLNQFDLSAYSLRFSDRSTVDLTGDAASIDRAINAKAAAGYDIQSITGPAGTLNFGAQDVTCGATTPDFEANAVATAEGCLGTKLFAESAAATAASALAQLNTIDLLINRPTTQFMVDIRRFVHKRRRQDPDATEQQQTGGGSGDELSMAGPWGVYFQGGGTFANLDTTRNRTGFNLNNQLATGGVDYRFSDAVVAGFLFNYTGSNTRLDKSAGLLDASLFRFMPFVSITPMDNAYIDIMAGYSFHDYASSRTTSGDNAQSKYSADQAMASINMGYTYSLAGVELTPFIGGGYVGTDVDGYQESGRGNLLSVSGYHVTSWTSTLGMQLNYAYSTSFGILQPHLRLEWLHEYSNNRPGISVTAPSQNLVVNLPSTSPIRDWGNLAAGVQAVLPNGVMGFVNYQAQVMQGGESHLVEGGVRMEF